MNNTFVCSDLFGGQSTCAEWHFLHPEYIRLAASVGAGNNFHRKPWEWVFIMHHLALEGVIGPGRRGLGFGVGGEPLTYSFAKQGAAIRATDAPTDIGEAGGWLGGNQLARGLSTIPIGNLAPDEFERLVSFSFCDMNNIDTRLREFDFCWSSCALEHLGSLRTGINFIINSVEETLRIGGVAVHTTEYNVKSNEKTLDNAGTVIYRRRDIDQLIDELRARGHFVKDFIVAPTLGKIDEHVDTPPYRHNPHLKLALEGMITTSCGIVVRRGC
jgi:hypothetical protein